MHKAKVFRNKKVDKSLIGQFDILPSVIGRKTRKNVSTNIDCKNIINQFVLNKQIEHNIP